MKKFVAATAAIGLIVAPPLASVSLLYSASAVYAQDVNVSINLFFDRLSDSGRWVRHPDYNYVWVPTAVDPDWAPYTHGHWIYVDELGWYFESDEPFAWAVYHYGRWDFDPQIGWFWVPGTIFAPAWVSWRRNGDVIGWAPLRPHGHGYVVTVEIVDPEPPPGYWIFVPIDHFVDPSLQVVIIERDRAPVLYTQTEFVGPVAVQNNIVINTTINIDVIQKYEKVTVEKIKYVEDPAAASQESGPVAFKGKLRVEEDAKPKQAEDKAAVEAPTKGQKIAEEAAPGAGDEKQGEEQAGQKADQQQQKAAEEPKAKAAGETDETDNAGKTAEQDKAAAGKKRLPAGEEAAGKAEEKAAKGEGSGKADAAGKVEEKAAEGKKRFPAGGEANAEQKVEPKTKVEQGADTAKDKAAGKKRLPGEDKAEKESRAQPPEKQIEKAKPPKKLEAQGTAGKAEKEQRASAKPAPRLEGMQPEQGPPPEQRTAGEPPVQQAAPPVQQAAPPQAGGQAGEKGPKPKRCPPQAKGSC